MDLLLDLLQGAGIAAAIGIRPFLPVLVAGAFAAADVGLDFEGTDLSFLESWWFLLAIVLAVAVVDVGLRRLAGADAPERPPYFQALLALAVVLGALLAAGTVADRSDEWWAGVLVGAPAAALGYLASRQIFARVRRRLDPQAASALPIYAESVGVVAAALCILLPPVAVIVLLGLAWLLTAGRRRSEEKYAGLRILR